MSMPRIRLIASVFVVMTPAIAFAASAVKTYSGLVNQLVSLMNMGVAVLVTLGFVAYFYGMSANILQFGSESNPEKKKAFFFWGIIILFVMLCVGGILRAMQRTLFTNQGAPSQQQQTP